MPTVAPAKQPACTSALPATPRQRRRLRSGVGAGAAALAVLLLTACAQQRAPGYYGADRENTVSDARQQAQGRYTTQAPSQIQLGFGNTNKNPDQQAAAKQAAAAPEGNTPRALLEAKTFLGTVPCMGNEDACPPSRMTLTLAPSGEWRARTVPLQAQTAPKGTLAEQGCWNVIGTQPLRILLQTNGGTTKANLTFENDNVLRINRLNDRVPTLDYRLTRQADIDPIDEAGHKAAPQCRS